MQALIEARRASATISYDPNIRPTLIADAARARERVRQLVSLADIVKVSDEDLGWLHPDRTPLDVARQWRAAGPAIVIVTRGGNGATAVTADGVVEVPGLNVAVIDTVGAGDTFMAAVIDGVFEAGLAGRARWELLARISNHQLEEILDTAVRAAAITVSRQGANPPWRQELAGKGHSVSERL